MAREDPLATARLFVALWPDAATRAALARWRDAWSWDPHAAPVANEQLHLTLHFLGALPVQRVPELIEALRLPAPDFTLRLDRPQRWSNGIAALTASTEPAPLHALHAALGDRLQRLGLTTEPRRWRPHVTLARRAAASVAPASMATVVWPVRDFALVESRPGAGYVVRCRFDGRAG